MALIIIAALIVVPLALLVWDLPRNADRNAATSEARATNGTSMGSAIHLHR